MKVYRVSISRPQKNALVTTPIEPVYTLVPEIEVTEAIEKMLPRNGEACTIKCEYIGDMDDEYMLPKYRKQ